jgi:hypothetical protein
MNNFAAQGNSGMDWIFNQSRDKYYSTQINHSAGPRILQRNTHFLAIDLHKNPYTFYLNRNEVLKLGTHRLNSMYSMTPLVFLNLVTMKLM